MHARRFAICIVSTAHPSHNPRVVKEALALSEAGFDVRIATCQHSKVFAEWDDALMRGRAVRCHFVRPQDSRLLARRAQLRRRAYGAAAARAMGLPTLAERALLPLFPELTRLACAEPVDLFIAHTPGALGPAARAAAHFGARLGFDAEDLHSGELPAQEHDSLQHRLVCAVEARYLRRCDQITAASLPMARALAARYAVELPVVIHNVFEWADREGLDHVRLDRRTDALSIYWFSQVVGLDRGLQELIAAAGNLRGAFELHVRGRLPDPTRRDLEVCAARAGVGAALHFHPKVPPQALLSRSAEHDVGVALEMPVSENRLLTVTNKVFHYALAGLALIATDTPGQRSVMQQMPDAGTLYTPGDVGALARALQALLDSPELLAAQRRAALEHARTRFSWEQEKLKLIARVEQTLAARARV